MTTQFSTKTLYEQVRDNIARRIGDGEWKPNAAVPNETDLARELGVSPGTMRKALDLLESEGLVVRRQGRGTFVIDPSSPDAVLRYSNIYTSQGERILGDYKTLGTSEGPATEQERQRLLLAAGEKVYRLRRVRTYRGLRFLVEDVAVPAAIFPGLTERNISSRWITEMAAAYRVLLGGATEAIRPAVVSASAAQELRIAEKTVVLILNRVISTRDGRPAEWRLAECDASHVQVKVQTI